jgi:hypothetical protein
MLDPATAFRLAVGAVQLFQQLNQLKNTILAKLSDQKVLRALRSDAHSLVDQLRDWEGQMGAGGKAACEELRHILQQVVDEIDDLKKRNWVKKAMTCLRVHTPPFQQRFNNALNLFHVRMSVGSQKLSEELLKSMTAEMKELRITMKQLEQTPGAESAIALIDHRIRELDQRLHEVSSAQSRIQKSLDAFIPEIVTQITEHVSSEGNETCELMRTLILEERESNDSLCRIISETSSTDQITWYDVENENSKPPFRICCLDDPQQNQPQAEFNGIAVSASSSTETLERQSSLKGTRRLSLIRFIPSQASTNRRRVAIRWPG